MDDSDVIFVANNSDSGAFDQALCDSEVENSDCDFDQCNCDKGCTNPHRPSSSFISTNDTTSFINSNETEIINLDSPKKSSPVGMSYLETDSISNIAKVSPTIKTEIKTIAPHRKVIKRRAEDEPQPRTSARKSRNQKTEPAKSPPKVPNQELEQFLVKNVQSAYSRGDIVWAKINGYSFWPAMIDEDPDINMCFWADDFSTVPTHYHVVFFDAKNRLSRSWCKPNQIKPYGTAKVNISEKHYNAYKARFRESVRQADEAMSLSIDERIKQWSFLSRKKKPGTQLCQD